MRIGALSAAHAIPKEIKTMSYVDKSLPFKKIVLAYTRLFTNSSDWLVKELIGISVSSLLIEVVANIIKDYCCKDEFSNLCLNLNDSLSRLTEDDLMKSEQEVVREFYRELYSIKHDSERQQVLQQIWDKLEFPIDRDCVVSLSYNLQLPGRFMSEVISREGCKFSIRPEDGHEVFYHVGYLKELLANLHKIVDVRVAWKDDASNRAENLNTYWNEKTEKVELYFLGSRMPRESSRSL